MNSHGKSAVEWLMTHAWSVLIVLCVSAVLFYAGVFEATGRPRFEGLAASAIQPLPEQVKLFSDGVLVLTVLNARPYSVQIDFVEVAPIADRDDVIQTTLDIIVGQADYSVFQINASNVYGQYSAFVLPVSFVSALEGFVDFNVCLGESYAVGGTSKGHVVCGKAWRIPVTSEASVDGAYDPCVEPCANCPCISHSDCPLWCQVCEPMGESGACFNEHVDSSCSSQPGFICLSTEAHPEGQCVKK